MEIVPFEAGRTLNFLMRKWHLIAVQVGGIAANKKAGLQIGGPLSIAR
jgi:hypothetical protein